MMRPRFAVGLAAILLSGVMTSSCQESTRQEPLDEAARAAKDATEQAKNARERDALCAAWEERVAAVTALRRLSPIVQPRNDSTLWTTMEELRLIAQQGVTFHHEKSSDGQRAQVRAMIEVLEKSGDETFRAADYWVSEEELARRAVIEKDLKWEAFLKARKLETLPVLKEKYPAFIESVSKGDRQVAEQREFLKDPYNISRIAPGVAVVECGGAYLFYHARGDKGVTGQSVFNPGRLGDIGRLWLMPRH